jgi:tRNA threonylcarbamoyladenosine biosynthesis protein TsaE
MAADPVRLTVVAGELAETVALAAAVALLAGPGDLIVLGGGLGAGKTAFTKGMGAALGVDEVITSPTFTLLRSYPTAAGFDLLHADLYRLEHLQEVIDLGLPELLEEGAVAVVEWGEAGVPALVADHLSVVLDGSGDGPRQITIAATGAAWAERVAWIGAALAAGTAP